MKITVFGATGGTGTHVVGQALAAGHDVTAVVRGATRPEVPADSRLYVAEAPLDDPDALVPLVTGRDAVISALGARGRGPTTVCADGARSITTAMRTAGGGRLVVVSASGAHTTGDGPATRLLVKPMLRRMLRHQFADMLAMEEVVRCSGLDWTIVLPPRLTNGAPTGKPVRSRVGGNVRGGFTIARADLAEFLLLAAADPGLVHTSVSVAHG